MKIISILVMGVFAIVLSMAVYRDIQADKHNPADLRNRVVGARLIKDGQSPYYYKWKAVDGIRYYDPVAFDTLTFSNMTATPFFHHLMAPIADLPQRQISRYWLLVQYFMLLAATGLFFFTTTDPVRKCLVLAAAALFLLTEGWQMNVQNGQNYLFIPFFVTLFYFALSHKKQFLWALAAGTIAVSLVLMRPNSVLFFFPFLLLLKNYSRHYLIGLFAPLLVLCVWFTFSKQERFLWQDYSKQVREQINMHQGFPAVLQHNDTGPRYAAWEGIDTAVVAKARREHPIKQHTENGNFFVLYNKIFHTKLSLAAITILSVATIFLLAGYFYYKNWKGSPALVETAIIGFCLYMISDLYSPVYRHQYYTVQWMFPLLLAVSFFRPSFRWSYLLVWTGLLLNCVNISFVKMEHTIGEYLLLVALIAVSLNRPTKQPV